MLSYYPPGVMPRKEHLENGALLNPHGHGWAIGHNVPRSMDSGAAIKGFIRAREQRPYLPALLHSRNATGDSPVTRQNIQPFIVIKGTEVMVFGHNGYFFPHEGGESDSRIFAREILPRWNLNDPDEVRELESRMGPNKAVILRYGSPGLILNAHLGIRLPDGTWHSNTDYLGVPHLVPGICPQCSTETDQKPVCPSCEEKAQARKALLMAGAPHDKG